MNDGGRSFEQPSTSHVNVHGGFDIGAHYMPGTSFSSHNNQASFPTNSFSRLGNQVQNSPVANHPISGPILPQPLDFTSAANFQQPAENFHPSETQIRDAPGNRLTTDVPESETNKSSMYTDHILNSLITRVLNF